MRVSPAFDRRLAELSPDSDRVWLAGLSTGLAYEDRPVAGAIEGGAVFALAIFAGYALAYALLELPHSP